MPDPTPQDEPSRQRAPASLGLGGRIRAWLQLFRLPNVFTALADVSMGYLVTHADARPYAVSGALLVASGLLYTAGMVLNDYFDRDIDLIERPQRPIPSGRVSMRSAAWAGGLMLAAGAGLGWFAGANQTLALRAGIIATLLACAVILYDRILKRTPLAPLAMGLCRFLNVLLGMSTAATSWRQMHWLIAAGIGAYIVGVTLFARTEARASGRGQLLAGLGIMAVGFWLLHGFPSHADAPVNAAIPAVELREPIYALSDMTRWRLFWCVTAALIGWRCVRAIWEPTPRHVQAAVKHCILSLIVLDAAVCWAFSGPLWAGAILLLLLPAMFLGQWIYST